MINMTQLNIKDLQHPQKNVAVDGEKGVMPWLARSAEEVLEDEKQATVRPNVLRQHAEREKVPHADSRKTAARVGSMFASTSGFSGTFRTVNL